MPMTLEAPLHIKSGLLRHKRHFVDLAVAAYASHAFGDVDAVIEVDVVRQPVDPRPGDRHSIPGTAPKRLENRTVHPDLRMAVHAGSGRRDAGEGTLLDGGVAVAAVDPEA